MTINRSQGQTMERVLVDVRDAIFAHGFLYVAMSRIKFHKNIMLYTKKNQVGNQISSFKKNATVKYCPMSDSVVYQEVVSIYEML
jgi:ATP-dependent exoDNAse (exonuclease V) alpha subunit